MTVELVGKEISWNLGETTATGGLFTRGSVGAGGGENSTSQLVGLFVSAAAHKVKGSAGGSHWDGGAWAASSLGLHFI